MQFFDTTDRQLLRLLGKKPQNANALAVQLDLQRTLVRYRLVRLQKHGYIRSAKKGRELIWSVTKKQTQARGIVQTYRQYEMADAIEVVATVPRGSIIFIAQGFGAAESEHTWIPFQALKRYHDILRKKQIKIIGCAPSEVVKNFSRMNTELLHSHFGRAAGFHMVLSAHRLRGPGTIIVSEQFIILANSNAKRATVIRDPQLASIVYESYAMLFQTISALDATKVIDLNALIAVELERRGEKVSRK